MLDRLGKSDTPIVRALNEISTCTMGEDKTFGFEEELMLGQKVKIFRIEVNDIGKSNGQEKKITSILVYTIEIFIYMFTHYYY